MKRSRTALATLLAVAGLVLAMDYATFAATGDSLVLGRSNATDRTTTLTTTGAGPALSLRARAGRPPLAVSTKGRVANLNADTVDGKHAADLANSTRRYRYPAGPDRFNNFDRFVLPAVPRGNHLVTVNTSLLPDEAVPVQCVVKAGGREYGGQLTPFTGGFAAALSVSAVVDVRSAAERIAVACAAEGGFDFQLYSPLVVTVTDTAVVTNGAITAD